MNEDDACPDRSLVEYNRKTNFNPMTNENHGQEKWRVYREATPQDGNWVCFILDPNNKFHSFKSSTKEEAETNAARIVAAVNFVEGISDAILKATPLKEWNLVQAILSQMSELSTLRAQVGEKERLLKQAVECHESERRALNETLEKVLEFAGNPDVHSKYCQSLTKDHWGSGPFPCTCRPAFIVDTRPAPKPKSQPPARRMLLGGDATPADLVHQPNIIAELKEAK